MHAPLLRDVDVLRSSDDLRHEIDRVVLDGIKSVFDFKDIRNATFVVEIGILQLFEIFEHENAVVKHILNFGARASDRHLGRHLEELVEFRILLLRVPFVDDETFKEGGEGLHEGEEENRIGDVKESVRQRDATWNVEVERRTDRVDARDQDGEEDAHDP